MTDLEKLVAELGGHGLCLRGVLSFDDQGGLVSESTAPRVKAILRSDGRPARLLCLVGYLGGAIWPHFERWRLEHQVQQDPLDAWSKAVIAPIACDFGGEAVFPSDRPWQPFQKWAMAAEGLAPSPLGILIHPEYGLWHGYRGAILFDDSVGASPGLADSAGLNGGGTAVHPCDTCDDKPCLSACPVEAFAGGDFDVAACRAHLLTDAGAQGCMSGGCRARDACPVGRRYHYPDAQIRFHMTAFL